MATVALVTSSFLPRFGGVEEHVLHVARALRDRGDDVVVWAVDQKDADVPAEVDGIRVRYLPCPLPARDLGALARYAGRLPGALRAWRRAVREDAPDVLHVHCFGPNGPWASWMARRAGLPLVVSSHGETFADADDVYGRSRLLVSTLRRALTDAVAVTAPSRYTLDDLEARFGLAPGRGVVVPNGIDLDEPVGERPAWLPARYVLAVGRTVGVKGFDLLIEAFARLDEPELALVVAGDGPERAALGELATARGVADRVVLPGRVDRPTLGAVMADAAVVAVPSRSEAFGIVVLETWRAGAPAVVTNRGGPPEFVTDGVDGLLVDPTDVDALAAALERVLSDDAFAAGLGRAGRAAVDRYTWADVAARYRRLLDASPG